VSDTAAVPYWEQDCHLNNRELCHWHCSAETWVRRARQTMDPLTFREWSQRPDVLDRAGAVLAGAR
jgi:hypothetical protein